MLLVRQAEMALTKLFADGEVPGFIHLSIGQEAIAAGVCSALASGDTLATTHRGHGHVLARGLALDGFFKEVMGRAGGICQGRGGSMHVADTSLGILGANGIVGAGIPIALGSALAQSVLGTGALAVSFFGDGAMAEGVLHETLNMAALWKTPLLLVCENNGWSEFSPTARQFAAQLGGLAAAFGIVHELVDGNDVLAVADAATRATSAIRSGNGPRLLECKTHRVRGHFEGDPQKYRAAEELQAGAKIDPLERAQAALRKAGIGADVLAAAASEVAQRIEAAITAARADGLPDFAPALADVYTPLPA
ncbi:thiamine pyrophosphate-dependent dehydrogenase E1 component subunit alpha [Piscinibacter sakaiensis]|uniref:thiamine pyrophosphate-dependent dehydrogenase E1 component subunit alpha n=1 Tax=Piscinibacter sakaiensis TaxID=1547922 RepID=UPI003AAA348B